jgi:hypothetical protein
MTEPEIEHNGKREFAMAPIGIFTRMQEHCEDMEGVALYDAAHAGDDGARLLRRRAWRF